MPIHEGRSIGAGTFVGAVVVLCAWSLPRVILWTEARQTLAIEAVARATEHRALLAAPTLERSNSDAVLRQWAMDSGIPSLAMIDISRGVHRLADLFGVSVAVHRERERPGASGITHLRLRITVRGRSRAVLMFLSGLERASPRAAVQRFVIAAGPRGLGNDASDMRVELVAEALVTNSSSFTVSR